MAEGIFKSLVKKNKLNIEISSAGTFANNGDNVSTHSQKALEKLGIDISQHKSTLVQKYLIEADLILTMTKSHKETILRNFPEAKDKVFLLNEYAYGELKDVADPYGGSLRDYERARDEIFLAAEEIVKRLKT